MTDKITGIVIAGGKSSRMGSNKALIEYNGKRLIDNAISILEPLVSRLIVSSNEHIKNLDTISDEIKDLGPIGGLYTCLKKSETHLNFVIPCDVPEVTTAIYRKMLDVAAEFDVVIPRLPDGKLEPLVGIYSRGVLPIIKNNIKAKDYKLVNLFKKLKVRYFEVNDTNLFKNVNSILDLNLPQWPNLLLIAGTNRNVGKTTLACKLIEQTAKNNQVVAIKITPHFHELDSGIPIIYKTDNLVIAKEINKQSGKDSSKMLSAGANEVYYVQATDENLEKALRILKPLLAEEIPIICESAALRKYINPGYFVLMSNAENPQKNKALIPLANIHIPTFNYNLNHFIFENGHWKKQN